MPLDTLKSIIKVKLSDQEMIDIELFLLDKLKLHSKTISTFIYDVSHRFSQHVVVRAENYALRFYLLRKTWRTDLRTLGLACLVCALQDYELEPPDWMNEEVNEGVHVLRSYNSN